MSSPAYFDIPTMTKQMKIPSVIVLPFHLEQPIPHSEERTFRPQDVEWPDALERWAFLRGYAPAITLKGKDYDPARQSFWPSLRWDALRAKALAGMVEKHLPGKHDQSTHGRSGGGSLFHDHYSKPSNALAQASVREASSLVDVNSWKLIEVPASSLSYREGHKYGLGMGETNGL